MFLKYFLLVTFEFLGVLACGACGSGERFMGMVMSLETPYVKLAILNSARVIYDLIVIIEKAYLHLFSSLLA